MKTPWKDYRFSIQIEDDSRSESGARQLERCTNREDDPVGNLRDYLLRGMRGKLKAGASRTRFQRRMVREKVSRSTMPLPGPSQEIRTCSPRVETGTGPKEPEISP